MSRKPDTPTGRLSLLRASARVGLFCLLFVLFVYQASWRPPWPASTPEEDAFISFRFAENIADGYGPVFNRSQDPVEGYTNFLWVMWLAAIHDEWPDTVQHALWSGLALGCLCLVAAYFLARRVSRRWAWCVPVVMALSRTQTDNALTGMETMAYNLWFLSAAALFAEVLETAPGRRRTLATAGTSCLLLLAALTRFEGIYLFGLFSLFWVIQRRRDFENPIRDGWWYLPFSVGYAIYTLWRVSVFDEWLPATYWAKLVITGTGLSKVELGFSQVSSFLLHYPALALMLIAFAITVPRQGRPLYQVFLFATVVIQLCLIILVGGDWQYLASYWRLFSTVAPIFLVLGLAVAETGLAHRRVGAVLSFAIAILLVSAVNLGEHARFGSSTTDRPGGGSSVVTALSRLSRLPAELSTRLRWLPNYMDTHPEKTIGEWLNDRFGSEGRIAGQHAGRIPYYSRLEFIDPIGFTDHGVKRIRWNDEIGESDSGRWPRVWDYLFASQPSGVLITAKVRDADVYRPFVAAADAHGYCLGNLVSVPSQRLRFLLFVPVDQDCPDPACEGSAAVAGRVYPLCDDDLIRLGGRD